MQSLNVIGSNIEKIQQLFPNCVTERLSKDGKPELAIDFEKLQAELSNDIIPEGGGSVISLRGLISVRRTA